MEYGAADTPEDVLSDSRVAEGTRNQQVRSFPVDPGEYLIVDW